MRAASLRVASSDADFVLAQVPDDRRDVSHIRLRKPLAQVPDELQPARETAIPADKPGVRCAQNALVSGIGGVELAGCCGPNESSTWIMAIRLGAMPSSLAYASS